MPQASVLGPLLFVLSINNLRKAVSHFSIYHFVDDTSSLFNKNCPPQKKKRKRKDTSMITFLKQYNTYLVLRSSHAWLRIGRQLFFIHLCRLLPGLCFPNSYLHYWDLFWRFFSRWFLVFLFFFPPGEVAIS